MYVCIYVCMYNHVRIQVYMISGHSPQAPPWPPLALKHVCCGTQQTCLLYHTADMSALWPMDFQSSLCNCSAVSFCFNKRETTMSISCYCLYIYVNANFQVNNMS